jgi:hypothetical protein
MLLRQAFGYTWVPGMLQPNVTAAAGGTPVGVYPTIQIIRRRGSIQVSTTLAGCPAFAPPYPPPALPVNAFRSAGGYIAVIGPTSGGAI